MISEAQKLKNINKKSPFTQILPCSPEHCNIHFDSGHAGTRFTADILIRLNSQRGLSFMAVYDTSPLFTAALCTVNKPAIGRTNANRK